MMVVLLVVLMLMNKDEDALLFMQKIYGETFENMTLEEFKALDINDLK